ncbi:MAG: hypothetical protein Kow006_11950 [Gammaproteobacteria bacterium]
MKIRLAMVWGLLLLPAVAHAHDVTAEVLVYRSSHPFAQLEARLIRAIEGHRMGLVAHASASRGARARGVAIPGNAVLGVFRNDYAVRMLRASVAAGIEAPLRIYLTKNPDGSTTLRYRPPGAVFAPYGSPELDAMARELDEIFAGIVADALGR